jgi:hypothetical protein
MVDLLGTYTDAAETIIGGMAGGFILQLTNDGIPGIGDMFWIAVVFLSFGALFVSGRWWYERRRGESFE